MARPHRDHADLRADAAAWAVIDELPGQPAITVAVDQPVDIGVLIPLSESKRNRAWEATGLLDLLAELEAGQ